MSDKLLELGIPQHEITPAVSIAVNGLLDHVDHLSKSLQKSKDQLEHLQQMVDIDPISIVPNRKALQKRLNWSIALHKRHTYPAAIVAFSINDYDSISNTYGYQAGSRVASYVAEFISGNIRDTDYFTRINESQFGVIMYFAQFEDVKTKAEKLCSQLRQSPFRWNNGIINVVIASGTHMLTAADDAESALTSALNAMYVDNSKIQFEAINFKA